MHSHFNEEAPLSMFFECLAKMDALAQIDGRCLQPPVCHLCLEFPVGQGIKTVSMT